MVLVLVVVLSLGSAAAGQAPWYEHYERGLALVEEGRAEEAHASFAAGVAARAEPGLRIHTSGLRYLDYLPHLYLAVTAHMTGDIQAAREHLAVAEREGVAARSEVGNTLLAAYRVLLATERAERAEPAAPPEVADESATAAPEPRRFRVFVRRDEVLSESEYEQLDRGVRDRCGMPLDTDDSLAPWYYHYELGLALVEKRDPQRALDALFSATDRRPLAQRRARMYGMWFTDYVPYFQIARAHVALGNWECAFDALEMSRSMGEIPESDATYLELVELENEVERMQDQ